MLHEDVLAFDPDSLTQAQRWLWEALHERQDPQGFAIFQGYFAALGMQLCKHAEQQHWQCISANDLSRQNACKAGCSCTRLALLSNVWLSGFDGIELDSTSPEHQSSLLSCGSPSYSCLL